MGAFQHDVVIKEEPKNLPMYRFEAQCSCSWNAKVPSLDEAKQAGDRHIKANGGGGINKVTMAPLPPLTPSFDPRKGTEVRPATPGKVDTPTSKFAPSAIKPVEHDDKGLTKKFS